MDGEKATGQLRLEYRIESCLYIHLIRFINPLISGFASRDCLEV
jgi:hypothetical protein